MTERRARYMRKKEIEKRNIQKKIFRWVMAFPLIALAELVAATFILYCKGSAEIRWIEMLVIILAGTAPAMYIDKI